jgi:hypothetical protein
MNNDTVYPPSAAPEATRAQNPLTHESTKARKKRHVFKKKEILMELRAARQVRHFNFARDRKVMN